jgi:hypothetical protein
MKFNDKFNKIFDSLNIMNVNKNKLLFYLTNLDKKIKNNSDIILCIIKSVIMIISTDVNNVDFCIIYLKKLIHCDIILINKILKIYNNTYYNFNIDNDVMIEKIIFHTMFFFETFIDKDINFVFNIYYNILYSLKKLIKKNINLQFNTYILLLNESKLMLLKNNNVNDILSLCNDNINIINKYIV